MFFLVLRFAFYLLGRVDILLLPIRQTPEPLTVYPSSLTHSIHMSPRWGLGVGEVRTCYIHVAPLGLNELINP